MNLDPQILELLPHRPPMTVLAQVLSVEIPGEAAAVADTSSESIFYDPALGGVPACVALEYMAQTMALAVGAGRRRKGEPPRVGFVLGTRRLEVAVAAFEGGKRYVASAKCVFADDVSASFDCLITGPDGETVATASLTAYQPPASKLNAGEVLLKDGE